MSKSVLGINIVYGTEKYLRKFYFTAADPNWSVEKLSEEFNNAVQELDFIYTNYGRFATTHGVRALFKKYGFVPYEP